MKKISKISLYLVLSLFIAVSLALTGCESEDLTVQDIRTNTISAMQKVDSYKADYNMIMEMKMTGRDKAMQIITNGNGTALADVRDEEMQMTMDMDMQMPGSGTSQMSMTMVMETYLVEGWQYMKMDVPGSGAQWMKMKSQSEITKEQFAQWATLLTSAIEINLSGIERVNGVECYVLEIVPDVAALWNTMMSQQGTYLTEDIDVSDFNLSEIIKNISYKNWISKNDFQMIQTEAEMTMEMDSETFGGTTEDLESMTMTMNMTMTFFDYNKAVNIELPAEALGAEEVDTFSY